MQNNHHFRSTTWRQLYLWLGLLLLLLLLPACGQLAPGWGPLLDNVTVAPDLITPNADGSDDVTQITYSLRRTASVSIYFTNSAGEQYYFRQERRRSRWCRRNSGPTFTLRPLLGFGGRRLIFRYTPRLRVLNTSRAILATGPMLTTVVCCRGGIRPGHRATVAVSGMAPAA